MTAVVRVVTTRQITRIVSTPSVTRVISNPAVTRVVTAPQITAVIAAGGARGVAGDPGPTGAASGATYTAGETLSALRAVRLTSSGTAVLAQPEDVTPVIAVTSTAATSGNDVTVVELGTMQDASWNWTIGLPVVLGANGTLTQDMSGMTRLTVIGLPLASDRIYVRIQPAIRLE